MFKINGENFEIEQAYIDAILDDEEDNRLIIGLIISGKRVDDNTLPYIDSETLLKIKPHEIKRWQDVASRVVEWGKPSKNHNRPYAKFLNFGEKTTTAYLYDTKIKFVNIDNKIFVKIKGMCNSKFNGKEQKTLSLEIETEVDFRWIQTGRHESEETARNRLKLFLDDGNFKYEYHISKICGENVKMGRFLQGDLLE